MKAWCCAILVVLPLVLLPGPAAAGTMKLEIRGGRVTLEAQDVTVREILAEWARIGRTRIENREQIGGAPVTLTLKDVAEKEALEILLRSVTGYIAVARSAPVADTSIYDVVYVLAAARPATVQGTSTAQSQGRQLIGGGRAGAQGPGPGMRPVPPMDDTGDDTLSPVMRPGFISEQMVGAPGAMPIQVQISPGLNSPATMTSPAQASQPSPASVYTATPGGSTTIGATTPGALPSGTPGTTAKPIKPPGGPVSAP
jgi:hypothetical protein